MNPDDRIRFHHIADALNSAIRFTTDRRREDLDEDQMLVFAVVHALQIVGEAASKISPDTRQAHPQIPWASIIGMRQRLVHAYFDVNLDLVWRTAREAAPALLPEEARELHDHSDEGVLGEVLADPVEALGAGHEALVVRLDRRL